MSANPAPPPQDSQARVVQRLPKRQPPRADFRDLRFTRQDGSSATAGPIVWISVLLATCVSLYVLQKVLVLVVPFLLALLLFYALFPVMARLILMGLTREVAALVVIGVFCVLSGVVAAAVVPRMVSELSDNQELVKRYFDGGVALLQKLVTDMEHRSNLVAQAHLSQALDAQLAEGTNKAAGQIQEILLGLISWGPSLALVPFLAYFLLKDSRHFKLFLSRAVPNAFFETTLYLMYGVDKAARAYFRGLALLTVLDTVTLALGLWLIGMPAPFMLGLIAAILAWIPYVGSVLGGILVALVAATDFSSDPSVTIWTIGLFLLVRMLDDFIYMPMTIGKSLRIHPLISVLMIFVGGAIAGVAGLTLVLPMLGIALVIGETLGVMLNNQRLVARYRQGRLLRRGQASQGLTVPVDYR